MNTAACLTLIGLLATFPLGSLSERQNAPEETAGGTSVLERRVVELTNDERAKAGLPPLKLQADLSDSARWLARDMAAHDTLDHTDSLGRGINPRLPSFGYTGYHAIGENIAGGQPTPEFVVNGWMHSPGHRANILNREFREIGAGYALTRAGRFHRYWVQDFGSRFGVYPLVINHEAAATRSPNVHLTIYGEGWAVRMRLSNDNVTWTPWEPYRLTRDWTLEPGKGRRTVTVEITDGETTKRAEDSVELKPALTENAPEKPADGE